MCLYARLSSGYSDARGDREREGRPFPEARDFGRSGGGRRQCRRAGPVPDQHRPPSLLIQMNTLLAGIPF